jgi:hypothetical protein
VATIGLEVAAWSYAFEPSAARRVTETWIEQRAGFFKPLASWRSTTAPPTFDLGRCE